MSQTQGKMQSNESQRGSLPKRGNNFSRVSPVVRGTVRNTRMIPRFSGNFAESYNPIPPPRSPPQSPRRENLPRLAERPPNNHTPEDFSDIKLTAQPNESKKLEKANKRVELRRKCLEEIYQTEKDYIKHLETLINVIIFPLRTMNVLDDKTLYSIFSNVEQLLQCNKEMLSQLDNTIETTRVGGVFTQFSDYFIMYSVYFANQTSALETVEILRKKNSKFRKKLAICLSDPRCGGRFLQDFLIKPVQRVTKYPLLLRDLIKYTPEDHPDWNDLQAALEKVNRVVATINEAQREAEGLQRILNLQKNIEGVEYLVEPSRKYVMEGELSFFKNEKAKTPEKRVVFFFTDLIVLSSKKGEKKYEHKLSIPIAKCKLVVLADSQYIKHAFELTTNQHKRCILACESPEAANQWIKEIRRLIKSYQRKTLLEMEAQKRNSISS